MPRVSAVKQLVSAVAQAKGAITEATFTGFADIGSANAKNVNNVLAKSGRAFSTVSSRGANNAVSNLGKQLLFDARATSNSVAAKCRCTCGRIACMGRHLSTSSASAHALAQPAESPHAPSLIARHQEVLKHFPTSMGVDDFIARVEMALAAYGFTGDNSIAMSNLCRDESCMIVEDKIESVFGACFSTHGLGGVLTCGVIGMGAGLSHSPIENGKERYVFFSFPHIAIDSEGQIGSINRPNRPGASAACGALIKTLLDLKAEGADVNCKSPGAHDPLEPEFSILKSRIARRIVFEKEDVASLDLVGITKVAERVITNDLEYLISKAVDSNKADYAVITGVQIHNWAHDLEDERVPSMEFVAPARAYVVVNGKKTDLDLQQVPALAPRQLSLLAHESIAAKQSAKTASALSGGSASSMLQEIPRDYLLNRLGGVQTNIQALDVEHTGPTWREYIASTYHDSHHDAPQMDSDMFVNKQ